MKNHISRIPLKALITAVFTVFFFTSNVKAQDGAKLFKQNCAVCHVSHGDQKLTGPGLAGVFDRAPKGDWLKRWILNNQKLIKSGDAYANKIYNDFGKAQMNVFEGQLNEKDVDAILAFLKAPAPVVGTPKGPEGDKGTVSAEPQGGIDPLYLIFGVIVILAILLVALRSVRTSLQNAAGRAEGKESEADLTFWEEVKNWIGRTAVLLVYFALLLFSWE